MMGDKWVWSPNLEIFSIRQSFFFFEKVDDEHKAATQEKKPQVTTPIRKQISKKSKLGRAFFPQILSLAKERKSLVVIAITIHGLSIKSVPADD